MALRNAFDLIATEGTLRKLLDQLRFAKDSADRMRIIADSIPAITQYQANTNANIGATNVPPNASTSFNVLDAREPMIYDTLNNFQNTRTRWTIT